MAYYNESDSMGPRRRALVDSLGGNTGVSGMAPGGAGVPVIGGGDAPMLPGGFKATADPNNPGKFLAGAGGAMDALKAYSGSAGAKQDAQGLQDYYKQHGTFGGFKYSTGVVIPDGPSAPQGPGPGLMNANASGWGGLASQAPVGGAAASAGAPAPKPDVYAPIAGFDFDKLSGKKAYDSADKYSDAVRTFSKGLGSGVQVSRNNLGGMIEYAKANGFGNAKAVGDDKIDFGDGKGPIDVVRGNGELWFQNGPDRLGPAPAAAGGAKPMFAGSTVAPMLQGDAQSNIQQAMQQMGSLSDPSRLQQLIAALQGGGQ